MQVFHAADIEVLAVLEAHVVEVLEQLGVVAVETYALALCLLTPLSVGKVGSLRLIAVAVNRQHVLGSLVGSGSSCYGWCGGVLDELPLLAVGAIVVVGAQPFARCCRGSGHLDGLATVAGNELVVAITLVKEDELLMTTVVVGVEQYLCAVVGRGVSHVEATVVGGCGLNGVDSGLNLVESPLLIELSALVVPLHDGGVVVGAVGIEVGILAAVAVLQLVGARHSSLSVGLNLDGAGAVVPVAANPVGIASP